MYKVKNLYKSRVGIEDMDIYIPKYYLDLNELAQNRNIEPSKYTIGLGCKKMSVLSPNEDSVTMAANAVRNLLNKTNISTENIGMLIVGTETAVDESKPIAVYLHKMLNLPSSCRVLDVKHACYAGTGALKSALSWLMTTKSSHKKAIVVTSDVAFYDLESPGEPTQGAGAVAMLVSSNPELLAIDATNEAVYTQEVMDFWRPSYRNSAIVDGHYSMKCYLEALKHTYLDYQKLTDLTYNDYNYFVFHTPFPKMAKKAHQLIYSLSKEKSYLEEELFKQKVSQSLIISEEVGNLYNASLFSALFSLINLGYPAPNKKVGLFSYGSGSTSEFFSGIFGEKVLEYSSNNSLSLKLNKRTELDYKEYLYFRKIYSTKMHNDNYFTKEEPTESSPYIFLGVQDHKRKYAYLPIRKNKTSPIKEHFPIRKNKSSIVVI